MKKVLSIVSSIALAAVLLWPVQPAAASDAEPPSLNMYLPIDIEDHWAYAELDHFVMADLIKGYQNGDGSVSVKPEQSVTRAEFVALLVRGLGLESKASGKAFADVEPTKWYYEPIRIASSLGIVNGTSDAQFEPGKKINRGELATMIVRAFKSSIDFADVTRDLPFVDVPDYFATESIAAAYETGIVYGKTELEFQPFASAKRAEAVVMLTRALDMQASDLPEDSALFELVKKSDTTFKDAVNAKQLDRLHELNESYSTGYQFALNYVIANALLEMKEEGIVLNYADTKEPVLTVLHKADRFAIVESTGGSYELTTTENGQESKETLTSDSLYLMKKMGDGSWKVYANLFDEEQQP
ncbi:S-layer homology domain-containing protein [Paenibacillus sp. GCM10027627]|uniref:S-layer homology domain-containing protein n=1 Tax=unclassified Paenibacillus TaxID=185978 RepID=UPI00363F77A8